MDEEVEVVLAFLVDVVQKDERDLALAGLDDLVFEYEAASQTGAVPFFEETVFCALADYFEKIRQLGKAQSILSDGLTQHPHSSELCLRRAELLLQNGQMDEARHWLEKAAGIFLGVAP